MNNSKLLPTYSKNILLENAIVTSKELSGSVGVKVKKKTQKHDFIHVINNLKNVYNF
jgi:hypothetical protein